MMKVDAVNLRAIFAKRREAVEKALEARYANPHTPSEQLGRIEKVSEDTACPECAEKRKGNPPVYDCGCDAGYECCAFEDHLQPPCSLCGYQGRVLVAPEGTPVWVLLEANGDPTRGLPPDGEGNWPKQRFWIPEKERPPKDLEPDPKQGKLWT